MYPQVYDYVIFRGSDIQDVSLRKSGPHDALVENDAAVSLQVNNNVVYYRFR